MNKLKISVIMKNPQYGRALARGITEESEGVEVHCLTHEKAFKGESGEEMSKCHDEILLTDMPQGFEYFPESRILFLKADDGGCDTVNAIGKLSPTKAIFDRIVELYIENTGKQFSPLMEKETEIIGFYSPYGGSGTTSVALILARVLAYLDEKAVLFINLSEKDNYGLYLEKNYHRIKTKKEFIFLTQEERKVNIKEYLIRDRYNVYYFSPESEANSFNIIEDLGKIMKKITESELFGYIVLDMGTEFQYREFCHKAFVVYDEKDMRSRVKQPEFDEKILNCSSQNTVLSIRQDPESFQLREDHVEISMDGYFGQDAEKIGREIVDNI